MSTQNPTIDLPRGWAAQRAESLLDGDNAFYLEALYESYLRDPLSVPAEWQSYFAALAAEQGATVDKPLHVATRAHFRDYRPKPLPEMPETTLQRVAADHEHKQVRVLQLINAFRFLGHLAARVNPLEEDRRVEVAELTLAYHKLGQADLNTRFHTGSLVGPAEMTLGAIYEQLRQTYCGSVGAEYMHIPSVVEKRWIQQRLESVRSSPEFTADQRRYILERLTAAEVLEQFLHTKYVGQKRFSLEGAESLIPLLDDLLQNAGALGVREIVFGMAHRGRLNVLVNILGKSPALLFKEFEGSIEIGDRTGDVKYHMGFSSDMNTPGGPIHVAMAFNPSHLEIVDPVVEGSVRARQDRRNDRDGSQVLQVLIHGDAAFAGQGVVMETLNMSATRGFTTRGTLHIIINNQIGFTTSAQQDARSTYYCTDVGKMVNAPIFHVNGDDPEAVMFVTQIALDYRMRFRKDVVIDMVCYRRHGHNEADEPVATQPVMYRKIRALPTTRARYAQRLMDEGVISRLDAEALIEQRRSSLEKGDPVVPHLLPVSAVEYIYGVDWKRFIGYRWDAPADTRITPERFRRLGEALTRVPDGFELHPRVARIIEARRAMAAGTQPIDWGMGECLAYAALVTEGHPVRLVGQDSGRGTFFHRHAVLHDQRDGTTYIPLQNIAFDQNRFTVIDSLLSEEAVLAFEYGYATTEPEVLTIWEAQFGDFANGAQVVIDQFISSGEQKWGRMSGLTMFLPHGYEGQGPEHSSARIERYLQLCAQENMQVCVPTTPAQMFHLLRRQMLRRYRKPLIVITPKSLLRHPLAVSQVSDFTEGNFKTVLSEIDDLDPAKVRRIILCCGKVYYDLLEARRARGIDDIAILRIEQLYPFPEYPLIRKLEPYPHVTDFIWCQEEPINQGAWENVRDDLRRTLGHDVDLRPVARPEAAAPAVGKLKVHKEQQQALIHQALST